MALPDPQSLPLGSTLVAATGGAPVSALKIVVSPTGTTYQTADGLYKLSISQGQTKSRFRRAIRLDHKKVAADPLQPATNRPYSMSAYLVIDTPEFGYSVSEAFYVVEGLIAWLTASAGAKITNVLQGES